MLKKLLLVLLISLTASCCAPYGSGEYSGISKSVYMKQVFSQCNLTVDVPSQESYRTVKSVESFRSKVPFIKKDHDNCLPAALTVKESFAGYSVGVVVVEMFEDMSHAMNIVVFSDYSILYYDPTVDLFKDPRLYDVIWIDI